MSGWLLRHWVALRQTVRLLARAPVSTLFNTAVIGVALAMPVGLHLLVDSLHRIAARLPATPEISVFMALDSTSAQIKEIRGRLEQIDTVGMVRFVSRENALDSMRRSSALAGVLDALPENPLPDAFVLRLEGASAHRLTAIAKELEGWSGVDRVQVDSAWAHKVEAALRVGRGSLLLLGGLLGCAMLAVTFNTIRLQLLTRQDEIALALLIGATHGFVRRPFLYHGLLQGVLGGGVALLIVHVGGRTLNQLLADAAIAFDAPLALAALDPADALAVLAFSSGLGWSGAWLSATRHLRRHAN